MPEQAIDEQGHTHSLSSMLENANPFEIMSNLDLYVIGLSSKNIPGVSCKTIPAARRLAKLGRILCHKFPKFILIDDITIAIGSRRLLD